MAVKTILCRTGLFLSLLFAALPVVGQQPRTYTIDNTHIRQLDSKQTGQQHEFIVSLPGSYDSSPGKKYPVLYYLDAYWDVPLLTAVYGNLRYDNVIPEFIMVGLSYPGDADYDRERRRDFTPTDEGAPDGDSGGAQKFLAFIKQHVVPLVESKYRVDSSKRALGGVSLGGLFTLYAMYDDPEFFDRYVSISPAAAWDTDWVAQRETQYAQNNKSLNSRLFLSYGTAEYAPFRDPIIAFQKQIADRNYTGLALQNYSMENLRHTGVKADGWTRGLVWVWRDLAPKGPSGLEKAYKGRD
jgi:predicted alpha/beta superfamily hydrolase